MLTKLTYIITKCQFLQSYISETNYMVTRCRLHCCRNAETHCYKFADVGKCLHVTRRFNVNEHSIIKRSSARSNIQVGHFITNQLHKSVVQNESIPTTQLDLTNIQDSQQNRTQHEYIQSNSNKKEETVKIKANTNEHRILAFFERHKMDIDDGIVSSDADNFIRNKKECITRITSSERRKSNRHFDRIILNSKNTIKEITNKTAIGKDDITEKSYEKTNQNNKIIFHKKTITDTPNNTAIGKNEIAKKSNEKSNYKQNDKITHKNTIEEIITTSDNGKDKDFDLDLPEEPTTCCMSGCANCVWIEYAEKLNELFSGESEKTKRVILEKVKDPNMKAFLQLELDTLVKKNQEGDT